MKILPALAAAALSCTLAAPAQADVTDYPVTTFWIQEWTGDATKMVNYENYPAPRANQDILESRETVTKKAIILKMKFRNLHPTSLDELFVNWDFDGDLKPDIGIRWYRSLSDETLRLIDVHGAYYDSWGSIYQSSDFRPCYAELKRVYEWDTVQVIVPKSCLADKQTITGVQVTAYDLIQTDTPYGYVTAKWDYIGGQYRMAPSGQEIWQADEVH